MPIEPEDNLIKQKLDHEQALLTDALQNLSHLLKTKHEREEFVDIAKENAWYNACRLVAQASNIQIHASAKDETRAQPQQIVRDIAKSTHFITRQITLSEKNWWESDAGALLGTVKEDGHPIALIPRKTGGYTLIDPALGTRKKVNAEIAATLADTAMMFYRAFPAKKISIWELIRFGLLGTLRDRIRLIVTGCLVGLLALFVPFTTKELFNSIIPGNEHHQLWQIIGILIVTVFAAAAFDLSRALSSLRIEGKLNLAVGAAIIERLINLPVAFFRKFTSGDLAMRAFGIDSIMQLLMGNTQLALLGGVFSLFSFIYMFSINRPLALLGALLVLIALIVSIFLNYWRLNYERNTFKLAGVNTSRIFQYLTGIAKLKVAGAELRAYVQWAKNFAKYVEVVFKAQTIANYSTVFNAGYMVIALFIIMAMVDWMHLPIHTGDFLAFNAAFVQFLMAVLAMSTTATNSLNAIPLYERLRPILHAEPEVDLSKYEPGELQGNIEMSHIFFRYQEEERDVLNDINFVIKPGEFVAFVGPSGSGKSTIFRLLLGLETAQSGAIYYDDKDLAELNIKSIRQQTGVVIQNAKLMPGNILTNILGASQATLEDAWEAARLAGLDETIRRMPMEMHTVITEGSDTISGGQKQRLLIARAIVKKPKILLFDEASSALDNVTQAIINTSLAQLNATRIIIAQRLSTVINADRIFVIDKGKIIETGTYQELIQANGAFTRLVARQILSSA